MRKFRRNKLREKVGNRNLRDAWEQYQVKKYGDFYKEACCYPQG